MRFGLVNEGVGHRRHGARTRVLILVTVVASVAFTALDTGQAFARAEYSELPGDSACETSVSISRAYFDPGITAAVVACAEEPLTAAPAAVLATVYGGPLLLTSADAIDPTVREELWRLGPDRIFVVSRDPSTAARLAGLFPELGTSGRIVMICGEDEAETSLLVARQIDERMGGAQGAVLLSADYAASAVGAVVATSSLAAAKSWPLIYVPSSGPLPETTQEVLSELAPSVVVEVQTTADVGPGIEASVLQGKDRYEVAARLAEYATTVGLSFSHTVVLCGTDGFSERGLALGPYLALIQGVAVLTGAQDTPTDTVRLLVAESANIGSVEFCGPREQGRELVRWLLDMKGLPADFEHVKLKQRSRGEAVLWLENRLAELSYWPGPIDGKFDSKTRQAVIAFEKWEGLKRDGVVGKEVWWELLSASRPTPSYSEQGRWIEVDKARQVLLYCEDGVVERTIAVSTGSSRVGIVTPSGTFHITRENTRERYRYKPLYLRSYGYLAIHGYTSVPIFAASHGCVRMTWADMDAFHALAPVGTTVHIY